MAILPADCSLQRDVDKIQPWIDPPIDLEDDLAKNRILQSPLANEVDAEFAWKVPIDEWVQKPTWARAVMMAHLRKLEKSVRWREIWDKPNKDR